MCFYTSSLFNSACHSMSTAQRTIELQAPPSPRCSHILVVAHLLQGSLDKDREKVCRAKAQDKTQLAKPETCCSLLKAQGAVRQAEHLCNPLKVIRLALLQGYEVVLARHRNWHVCLHHSVRNRVNVSVSSDDASRLGKSFPTRPAQSSCCQSPSETPDGVPAHD